MSLADDYVALRRAAGAVRVGRDFVLARGPDAESFLEGQLSQHIAPIAVGAGAWSWLLQPQGKVVALLRVTRLSEDEWLLDTDSGWGEVVRSRLERFKLRVKCELEALAWHCLAVRGPAAPALSSADGALRLEADWPGWPGFDIAGASPPPLPEDVAECTLDAYEAVRIEAGIPRMGAELDERTIPAEAGRTLIERAVSFTKGCYTGQELVARIDSRGGNVPRRLHGAIVDGDVAPPAGATLSVGGRDVGRVTSAAWSPGFGAAVALVYAQRDVMPPCDVDIAWEGGTATARVEELPLAVPGA